MLFILLFWVAFSVIVGVAASRRCSRSFIAWFIISIVFSPLLAVAALIAVGPVKHSFAPAERDEARLNTQISNLRAELCTPNQPAQRRRAPGLGLLKAGSGLLVIGLAAAIWFSAEKDLAQPQFTTADAPARSADAPSDYVADYSTASTPSKSQANARLVQGGQSPESSRHQRDGVSRPAELSVSIQSGGAIGCTQLEDLRTMKKVTAGADRNGNGAAYHRAMATTLSLIESGRCRAIAGGTVALVQERSGDAIRVIALGAAGEVWIAKAVTR